MNILVSTTLYWNPGDSFIRQGCLNLLAAYFPNDFNVMFYNRNPDLMSLPTYSELKKSPFGNYYTDFDPEQIDVVLIAGSPEWNGKPLTHIYETLRNRPDIPILLMGVGVTSATPKLSDAELEVLKRPSTRIIARSAGASDWFAKQGVSGVAELPCPALFCTQTKATSQLPGWGHILQKPGRLYQEIESGVLEGMPDILDNITTFHKKEYEYYYKRLGRHRFVRYTPDWKMALEVIAWSEKIMSTRLHGSIGALSTATPAVMLVKDDERILGTCKLFPEKILPRAENYEAALRAELPTWAEIVDFKNDTRRRYRELLDKWNEEVMN